MPPSYVKGLFLLAFHLLSLSVGATLGSHAGTQIWTDLLWHLKRWREVLEQFYVIMFLTSGVTFAKIMVVKFEK
jgi:hypothetical protein